jgi:endonuclease/exonuclease/phosphatase family metal-dependent hydrolase
MREKTMQLRLLTFNIRHGKGMDGQVNLQRTADVIKYANADMIGLNEVDKHFSERSAFIDQTAWLAKELSMEYAYGPAISIQKGKEVKVRQYGNALLTRFPIVERNNHLFNILPGIIEGRSILETKVLIKDQMVYVFVTHLSLSPFLHRKQTEQVIQRVRHRDGPVIVMGDWNMKPHSKGWNQIEHFLTDAWKASAKEGMGKTYPSYRPRNRLDYIFVSSHFQIMSSEVLTICPDASDHLPVIAIVEI